MITTRIFKENFLAYRRGARRALNEGGTASTKTWSIVFLLTLIANKESLLISIVSESLPHLKRGAIRDLFNILDESPDNNPYYNKTEHVYQGSNWKGQIEFFGADEAAKVRGPRRDILFINEANNIPWEAARGLDIRTNKFTFVDWNPVSEFWAHENWIGKPENKYIHSTYLDAIPVLPPEVIENIESNKKDPNWWNIYGLGKIGKIEGLVYPQFKQIDYLPGEEPKLKEDEEPCPYEYFYGLDFGFSNDVTALTKNVILADNLFSKELIYQAGLTNKMIAHKMIELGIPEDSLIIADSAEPKSIAEIAEFGFNIIGCKKGAGSVEYRHQKVNQYNQHWTKDSVHCIKEQRNFRYIPDKDGKLTDKTTHQWSHGMDGRDYGVVGFTQRSEWGVL